MKLVQCILICSTVKSLESMIYFNDDHNNKTITSERWCDFNRGQHKKEVFNGFMWHFSDDSLYYWMYEEYEPNNFLLSNYRPSYRFWLFFYVWVSCVFWNFRIQHSIAAVKNVQNVFEGFLNLEWLKTYNVFDMNVSQYYLWYRMKCICLYYVK